jgi:hypothetical protein
MSKRQAIALFSIPLCETLFANYLDGSGEPSQGQYFQDICAGLPLGHNLGRNNEFRGNSTTDLGFWVSTFPSKEMISFPASY